MSRHSVLTLSEEILLDFEWWNFFCSIFNGSANIIPRSSSVSVVSDASMDGYGAWCDHDWFIVFWQENGGKLSVPIKTVW